MTRDEAIKIILEGRQQFAPQAGAAVDAYVKLGMLKLDEPKSAETKFQELIFGYLNIGDAQAIEGGVKRLGLKIVEK